MSTDNQGKPVPAPYPYNDAPKFLTSDKAATVARPSYLPLHACMGLNSCAGSDRYGLAGPKDGTPNACAGQGYCSTTADHTCHVTNNCANQGGCGLYGTGEEMNNPGHNDCRSQGSCATPINAERFSTNGPNRGKSVWMRAREVFETEVWPTEREKLQQAVAANELPDDTKVPRTLGPVPALFADTGPTYLWISDENTDRGAMTSCGASGLSGAGGCG